MNITPTPQVRAGCYLRISSDPDDERDGVDRQKEDTTALCEVQGWTVAGFYEDDNRSASNGKERPEWDRLLADIKAGKIDAIAAWDQDRNWRMMHELEDLRKFFASLGREVKLATTGQGGIDLFSPTGVMMAQIKTAVSEHEIAMMKVRMRRAAKQKAERGLPQWKHAFGYLVGEHTPDCPPKCKSYHHQPDPKTAPLVEKAYEMIRTSGTTLRDIATMFNDAEAYGLNKKPWSETTVSLFLRAPRNAGLRAHNDELVYGEDGKPVMGTWPPLVKMSTWKAAQAKLGEPGRAPGPKSVKRHLLTGLLKCGNTELSENTKKRLGRDSCGGHLGGNWQMQKYNGPGAHTITYRCTTCRGVNIRAEHIEPRLYDLVTGRLMRPDAVDLLKAEHDEAEAEAIRAELTTLYGELEKIGIERGQLLLTGQQAKIATDLINEKITKLEHRQQDAERLRVFEGLPLGTPEVAEAIRELTPDRIRAVLDLLLTITIKPVGKGGHVFNPERVVETWKC
jgi:DNA invertase Pin-like site-specific DNA recombinase